MAFVFVVPFYLVDPPHKRRFRRFNPKDILNTTSRISVGRFPKPLPEDRKLLFNCIHSM